ALRYLAPGPTFGKQQFRGRPVELLSLVYPKPIPCSRLGGDGRAMLRRDTKVRPSPGATASSGGQERTALFTHRSMALIKPLKLPATPRIYEFCYAYATGEYPSLNAAIND